MKHRLLSLQTRRRNKITNVDTWYNAYGIFCYIYLKKYPNDARSLLKYGSLVRGIARSGGDFAGFDERFRYLRQQTLCSWDSVNADNYITSRLNCNRLTSVRSAPESTTQSYS